MFSISNIYPIQTDVLAKSETSLADLSEIIEGIAYELAGDVPTTLCSELILISARLDQISQQFRNFPPRQVMSPPANNG